MITLLSLLLLMAAPPTEIPGSNLPRNTVQRITVMDVMDVMDWLTKQQANQQHHRTPGLLNIPKQIRTSRRPAISSMPTPPQITDVFIRLFNCHKQDSETRY